MFWYAGGNGANGMVEGMSQTAYQAAARPSGGTAELDVATRLLCFDELLERYQNEIFRYSVQLTRNTTDANDVCRRRCSRPIARSTGWDRIRTIVPGSMASPPIPSFRKSGRKAGASARSDSGRPSGGHQSGSARLAEHPATCWSRSSSSCKPCRRSSAWRSFSASITNSTMPVSRTP